MSKKYNGYVKPEDEEIAEIYGETELPEPIEEDIPEEEPEVEEPKEEVFNTIYGKVNCPLLNVRKGPSKETEVLRVLKQGDSVEIIGAAEGWYKISPEGFVMTEFID